MYKRIPRYGDLGLPSLKVDGFDDCIIGLTDSNIGPSIAYDRCKMIDNLMSQGMDMDEAEDYFNFNISGAHFSGGISPIYITTANADDIDMILGCMDV